MRIGYARVSTKDQSLDLQLDALRAAGCERIYSEHASGRKKDRAELDKLLGFAREGDVVVVWKLDRLGRTMTQLVQLMNDFNDRDIQFVSLTEGIDTTTPIGRCMYSITAAFAAMEAELASERTKAGLEAARAKGHVGGRPKAKEADADRVAMAINGGMTVREACNLIGISPATYYKYRNNIRDREGE